MESVQIQLAGKWLACSSKTTKEVIWGDLGLEPLKVRRDKAKLKEWGLMGCLDEKRLEKLAWGLKIKFAGRRRSWQSLVQELVRKYGLEEMAGQVENGEMLAKEWGGVVEKMGTAVGVTKWWDEVSRKSKLRRYEAVKEGRWGMEKWMRGEWTKEKKVKFRWRSGSNGLMEDMGRREGKSKECVLCGAEEESVEHVLWECDAYGEVRYEFGEVMKMEARKVGEDSWWEWFCDASHKEKTRLVLGGEVQLGVGEIIEPFKAEVMLEVVGLQLISKVHELRAQLVYGGCPTSSSANECGGSQSAPGAMLNVSCHK